jgi:pyroglutamyl-peptidase
MTATILITGFGPFPGAPFNPSEPLALRTGAAPLSRLRRRSSRRARFRVTYEAVDAELPALIAREKPAALVMFGLAARTKHMRIETRARNVLTRILPDADGQIRTGATIAPGAPVALSLRAPAQRLLTAALASGVPAALSHDAGRYVCNYLCWRAAEAAGAGALRLAAFIHVPKVRRAQVQRRHPALTLDDLARAGEAIVRTALAAAR